jgi:SAM-dependent methyltransferase
VLSLVVIGAAVVAWLATFVPAWRLLLRLSARALSESSPVRDARFWLDFVVYRLLIAAPYLILLFAAPSGWGALVRSLIIGWIALGVAMSALRLFGRRRTLGLLWSLYARVYDALSRFVPYRRLPARVEAVEVAQGPVIDLGCGTGNLLAQLAPGRPGVEFVGVDSAEAMLERARRKLRDQQHVRFLEADVADAVGRLDPGSVGAVYSVNQLYALPADQQGPLLEGVRRALRPSGTLVLVTAVEPGLWSIIREHVRERGWWSLVRPSLIAVFVLNLMIESIERSGAFEFVPQDELLTLLETAGFVVERCEPVYAGTGMLVVAEAA